MRIFNKKSNRKVQGNGISYKSTFFIVAVLGIFANLTKLSIPEKLTTSFSMLSSTNVALLYLLANALVILAFAYVWLLKRRMIVENNNANAHKGYTENGGGRYAKE